MKKIFLILTFITVIPAGIYSQIPGAYADGIHKDTKAIQAAFDSIANLGGGMVRFTPGVYLTGPFILKGNNLTMQIDSGATILASPNMKDYYPDGADTSLPLTNTKNFISASGFSNMTIQGKGTIDGQGSVWWPTVDNPPRPRMLQLDKGVHLEVKEVTLTNSPKFHLCPNHCYDVYVHDIRIIAPSNSPNTDGVDPSICHKVLITNCYIDNGDDDIAIGSSSSDPGWTAASTDITIKNNTFMHGHGVSIGSYTSGGVDSMLVDSCTFTGTDNGIRIKSQRDRGGNVRGITYSNLTMTNVRYPIYFTAFYSGIPLQSADTLYPITSTTPYFHDINVINLTSTNSSSSSVTGIIVGVPEEPFTNITLQNVKLTAYKGIELRNATISDPDTMLINVTSGPRIIYELRSQLITGINDNHPAVPDGYLLEQNYPNPFNPTTTISYQIPQSSFVSLRVYNILGNEVSTLVNEQQAAGKHSLMFRANNLASGVYFYKLQSGSFNETKKLCVLK
ncbi:MAG: glycosyl hydrolase family 28 protein [Ignavibacteriaceae bacterium]|nr:glycosyl hydrolase family 28 protein [Ignavibacteriaceae bacterium]